MRRSGARVADRLVAGGYGFEFHEAARILARWAAEDNRSLRSFVRFRSMLSTSFPPSQIHEVLRREDANQSQSQIDVVIALFGLFGAQGVLPITVTERLIARRFARDTALQEFLGLFDNRLAHLFHEAWERSHFFVRYERRLWDGSLTGYLFDLVGLGPAPLRGRSSLRDESLLYYAGLLAQRPKNMANLTNLLGDYFAVPVQIVPLQGGWHVLPHSEQTRLGRRDRTTKLGEGAIAGDSIWIHHSRFLVVVGPVSLEQFRSFLPGGAFRRQLADLTRFFVGLERQFDLRPVLKTAEVPPLQLTSEGSDRPRLGWSAWLSDDPHSEPPAMPSFSVGNESDLM